MKKGNLILVFLAFSIPYFLIYHVFLNSGSLAWGDAPFFNPENLRELFSLPLLWNFKDHNFGVTQYHVLWLYIPTFLYGLLNHYLGLGNNSLERIIFYFPASILSIAGAWVLIGSFTKETMAKLLGSVLYGFNTYLVTIIDGGQVGVAVAYGIFPLTVFTLLKFLEKASIATYIPAFLSLFLIINFDLRITFLALFFVVLWKALDIISSRKVTFKGYLFNFMIITIPVAAVNSFWIYPFIISYTNTGLQSFTIENSGDNFVMMINSLFLFQPHFPLNEFGKVIPVSFYFGFLPTLFFTSLFLIKGKEEFRRTVILSLIFLIYAYFAKGSGEPLGSLYSWLVSNMPFGAAFRDSSKFFAPLVLTGSLLLAFTVTALRERLGNNRLYLIIILTFYFYLLFLIHPALLGNMSGVLGGNKDKIDYQIIFDKLNNDQDTFKTLWFDEKTPVAFFNWSKPALSADNLYKERPFASQIVGKYDLYNYLHSPQLPQWFKLLGIKYLFFPGNERKKIWTAQDTKERRNFLQFVETLPYIHSLQLPIKFPAYKLSEEVVSPIFAQRKAFIVVGGEDIYEQLFKIPQFALLNQGFIFLENDGVDFAQLSRISSNAAVLVLYNKSNGDLMMSLLKDKMVSSSQALENQWMQRASSDYLIWKYDLLKQGINSKEFDFKKGISFSTMTGEKIHFGLDVPQEDKYYLAVRFTNSDNSQGIRILFAGHSRDILNKNPENFKWEILGPFTFEKGRIKVDIINLGGFELFNTLALISEKDLKMAQNQTGDITAHFKTIRLEKDQDFQMLYPEVEKSSLPVIFNQINPTEYKIENLPNEANWLIFSDRYYPSWKLEKSGNIHLPFYAMINGFYIEKSHKEDTLIFSPQRDVKNGIYISIASLGLISSIIILFYIKSRKTKKY